jgi:arylsulfatase A-like enzyme
MKRFTSFGCAVAALLFGVLSHAASPSPGATEVSAPSARQLSPLPNVILIVADDLGYGDLGCYGQPRIKTPNLDVLASQGMRFTSFYAGSTVCAPSRCALMTGFHVGHARIRGNANIPLEAADVTLAEVLKGVGYHTGLVGKWGLGNENTSGVPQKQGFDEFVGYLDQTHAHDYYTDYLWRYDPVTKYDDKVIFSENQGGKKGLYIPDLLSTAGVNFVKNNQPGRLNHYSPFFLFLSYTFPHANNEEGRRSGNGMQVPDAGPYASESWPQVERNKAAMITLMDGHIGTLLDQLQKLKLEDNTVVFFTSDNGPHKEGGVDPKFFKSSGPFRGIKRDLYEGGIRVPMIVRWPARIPAGVVSDQPWAMWDLLPTVAEMARAKAPAGIDGISMVPTLTGQPQTNQHEFFYWEFHEGGSRQAVRMGDWKGIRNAMGKPLELYDLKADPGEKHDVAEQNTNVVTRIERILATARTESKPWPLKPAPEASRK